VCTPSKVASRTTSRHHKLAKKITVNCPKKNKVKPNEYPWIYSANPKNIKRAPKETSIGQGLAFTK
jgi:hypothetical protein